MFKIIIDAGHGGKDIGVKGQSSLEKDLNLFEAKQLAKELNKFDIEVILTREIDEYININSREIYEDTNVLISFHKNGSSHNYSKGCEVIYSKERKPDLKHAVALSNIISDELKSNDLGGKIKLSSRSTDYHKIINMGLEKNVDHVFLINTGYLTNTYDEIKLKDKEIVKKYIRKIAEYIFFTILNDAIKIKFELNNEKVEIGNIVKGDKVFVDINQLKDKINIPIKYFKENEIIKTC